MAKSILSALALVSAFGMTAGTAVAQPNAGSYLAARSAAGQNDFTAASSWFSSALEDDPTNPDLIENLLASRLATGNVDAAIPVAEAALGSGMDSQLANMVLALKAAQSNDWNTIFDALEAGHSVGPLVDGLTRAWAYVGKGDMRSALDAFDEVIEAPGMRSFGLFHKALALATVGDFEGAEAILSLEPSQGMARNRRTLIARAQVLSQLGQSEAAVAMLDEAVGPAPDDLTLRELRTQLETGEPIPFSVVTGASTGLAEVYYTLASILSEETPETYVLLYSRIAQALHPDDADIAILTAELLDMLGAYPLASAAYATVPQDDPAFFEAELGRAEVLRKDGETALAIEVLGQLIRVYPDLPMGHITLGDAMRQSERFDEAIDAYSRAIDLMDPRDPRLWFVFYMRAIGYHRVDNWPEAEADFRSALALNPDQPQILNYLGYSLVERREKLDEALQMIETAVDAQPQNGAIIDSLGWAYFVLGRIEDAVEPMERAAELEPVDPIVLDHLGDVLWSVGRKREARFQWQRALSFDPEPDEATRIRRKLEVGLDQVLTEEGVEVPSTAQDL
ncbi:tetratricopeptide repeat protein [Flavimaricola marinus]|uniref:Lipoprotein NlpI n=1 Tax=Flavimaricola marinus TaxID=1819565 RepID=A0A238LAZ3_9RHOB|nr:tetratricopeptide repeat protein [Flavimaricola marinus]SMY06849.1 lipoprotein NlpI [Flavimaricola marinus]